MNQTAPTLAGCTISILLSGCASAPPATQDIARARTLIDQAAQRNAQRYAAADLNAAREKLRLAVAADQRGRNERAADLAEAAAADAQLALARVESAEAKRAAEEIQRSVEALRRETRRTSELHSTTTYD
jgi:hypothetical protein